jgi:hypothetical protein
MNTDSLIYARICDYDIVLDDGKNLCVECQRCTPGSGWVSARGYHDRNSALSAIRDAVVVFIRQIDAGASPSPLGLGCHKRHDACGMREFLRDHPA